MLFSRLESFCCPVIAVSLPYLCRESADWLDVTLACVDDQPDKWPGLLGAVAE